MVLDSHVNEAFQKGLDSIMEKMRHHMNCVRVCLCIVSTCMHIQSEREGEGGREREREGERERKGGKERGREGERVGEMFYLSTKLSEEESTRSS